MATKFELISQNSKDYRPQTLKGLLDLAADMDANNVDIEGPVREVFSLLGDKWSKLILLVLATGTYGHARLRRTLEILAYESEISQRILTLKLRSLERDGLIIRSSSNDIPPRVNYSLSAIGNELVEKIQDLIEWINHNQSAINSARKTYDADNNK